MENHLPDPALHMEDGEYKPKNILLTGGAGFIGSHVAIRLLQRYPEYKASSKPCYLYQAPSTCLPLLTSSRVLLSRWWCTTAWSTVRPSTTCRQSGGCPISRWGQNPAQLELQQQVPMLLHAVAPWC
jgi:hypothetical protein